MNVAIIGYGYVGKAYHKMFPDAVIYDEPQELAWSSLAPPSGLKSEILHNDSHDNFSLVSPSHELWKQNARIWVNDCDLALICVPTDLKSNQLDMSIVEDVISWVETPLILIKSALQPGTVDRLVKETGKKIAVSVEMVGEGKYYVPDWKYPNATDPTKHNFLIVGGEDETARRCADFLWSKMSPDINIHLTTAIEAEITKLFENSWGALKVSLANAIYDICEEFGANYTRVLQAWGSDGRVEKMHMRVIPNKRGWFSKCYNKDVPALAALDKSGLITAVLEANKLHRSKNNDND